MTRKHLLGFVLRTMVFLVCATTASGAWAQDNTGKVIAADQAEIFVAPNGLTQIGLLLNSETVPDTPAAVSVLTLQAEAAVPEHVHDGAVEILYVIEGGGSVTIGGQTTSLSPGSVVYLPADVPHSYVNDSGQTTSVVQVYVGPGSEARFRSWTPQRSSTPE